MAKKKSVAISRKPTAGRELPAAPEILPQDAPAVLDVVLDPPSGPVYGQAVAAMPRRPAPPAPVAAANPGPLGKLVYGTVFGISYGVVFTAILLGKLIPGSGLMRRAMGDGADSAERFFEARDGVPEEIAPAGLEA